MASETPAGQVAPAPGGTAPEHPAGGQTPLAGTTPTGTPPAVGSTAGTPAGAPKAPATYALSIPTGKETFVDAADLAEFTARGKANDWTNEEAQEALDQWADEHTTRLAALHAETEADPEYGREKLEATQQLVKRVLDRVRPDGHPRAASFRRLLNKTGIGNHLEMFSFLADLGKLMREDAPPVQGSFQPGKRTQAEILYSGKPSS